MPALHPRMHGVSHVPGGPDPIPGMAKIPTGDTIDAVIAGFDPAGFWKLNESSGSVAADSSGNGLDLTSDSIPPTWGAAAGPPGEQAANFQTGTGGLGGTAGRVARAWAAISTDFTAGIFISRNASGGTEIMGQGNPTRSGGSGWELDINGNVPANKPSLMVRNSGTLTVALTADNNLAVSTWALVAAVHEGGNWRLNVNGLEQTGGPVTGAYTPISSALWIGHDNGLGGSAVSIPVFTGSYAFLIPSALSGADLLSIYESATIPEGANSGKALLATGLGGTTWDFAIEVTY